MATTHPFFISPSTGLEAPYPLQMEGKVIHSFGRDSNELRIPTANLPINNNLAPWIADIKSGVYFGWASLHLPPSHSNQSTISSDTTTTTTALETYSRFNIYPMVMLIGYNKFYKNMAWSAEAHMLYDFGADFYSIEMRLLVMGFIREEKDYTGVEELIKDICMDCKVAHKSLDREAWALRETGKGTLDRSWLVQ